MIRKMDDKILEWIDGSISEEKMQDLEHELENNGELRAELSELCIQEVQLRRLFASELDISKKSPPMRTFLWQLAKVACLVFLTIGVGLWLTKSIVPSSISNEYALAPDEPSPPNMLNNADLSSANKFAELQSFGGDTQVTNSAGPADDKSRVYPGDRVTHQGLGRVLVHSPGALLELVGDTSCEWVTQNQWRQDSGKVVYTVDSSHGRPKNFQIILRDNWQLTDKGTIFDVEIVEELVQVQVKEGRVGIEGAKERAELKPGDMARLWRFRQGSLLEVIEGFSSQGLSAEEVVSAKDLTHWASELLLVAGPVWSNLQLSKEQVVVLKSRVDESLPGIYRRVLEHLSACNENPLLALRQMRYEPGSPLEQLQLAHANMLFHSEVAPMWTKNLDEKQKSAVDRLVVQTKIFIKQFPENPTESYLNSHLQMLQQIFSSLNSRKE